MNNSFWLVTLLLTDILNRIPLIKIGSEPKCMLKFVNSKCVYVDSPVTMLLVLVCIVLKFTEITMTASSYLSSVNLQSRSRFYGRSDSRLFTRESHI